MIPRSGTFDYVGTVPDGDLPWTIELSTAVERGPDDPGLAGAHAWLKVEDVGMTPNGGYDKGVWRPAVLRARFSILAGRFRPIARSVAHFHVDLGLTRAARAGDGLHVSSTGCGGVGLSALRDGGLVYAVGAITAVPLGDGNSARIPRELIEQTEAVFRQRDPRFALPEIPLELTLAGHTMLLPSGAPALPGAEGFDVLVLNGFRRGVPGTDPCAAVSRRGLCPDTSARSSAHLLAADRLGGG